MVDIAKELKAGFEEFKQKNEQDLEAIRNLVKESQNGTRESLQQAIDQADKAVKDIEDVSNRLVEAEQKLVDRIAAGKEDPKSVGILVVENQQFKDFATGKTAKCRIEVPRFFDSTTTGQSGSPLANNDTLNPAHRLPGVIPGATRMLRVRDVIPQGETNSNAIEVTRESSFTNNAAETAEGATKPETDIVFELYSTPVKTIAHWLKVSTQVKDDAPQIVSHIETRLRYGVELREDQQLISGDGTGQNLTGMTISPNMTAFTPTSGDTALDTINRQKYVIAAADYMPTAIVLHPTDWGNIERSKDSQNRYIIGDPHSALGPFLWGLPVIVTPSMTAGKLLIAAFDIAFQLWNRKATVVEMFEQDDKNAQQNLLTIRAEKRCALAGYRPASVRFGNLTV